MFQTSLKTSLEYFTLGPLDFSSEPQWKNYIEVFDKPHYFDLVRQISMFKATIEKAANEYAPSIIAKYLLNLAQSFNKFYSMEKINVEEDKVRNSNFALAKATRIVLNEGLRLLGIHYLEEM